MYRSYSYNNMPKPVNMTSRKDEPPAKSPEKPKPKQTECAAAGPAECPMTAQSTPPVIGRLHTDDIVLLIVIALLLLNDCDDKLLLLALAYVFFSDYFG